MSRFEIHGKSELEEIILRIVWLLNRISCVSRVLYYIHSSRRHRKWKPKLFFTSHNVDQLKLRAVFVFIYFRICPMEIDQ